MRALLQRNDFAGAVTRAAQGIPAHPEQPVRAGMHVTFGAGQVHFAGSDGDITVRAQAPAECEEGECILPGKLLAEVAKSLPDCPVTLTDGTLSCGTARFTFGVSHESYPGPYATAPLLLTAGLSEAFAKVAPMANRDDPGPYAGVLLEPDGDVLHVTASDRYRVGTVAVELDCEGTEPVLVPASAVSSFPDGQARFGWDSGVATFATDDYSVTTRRLAGTFPKWRSAMAGTEPVTELPVKAVREMIGRTKIVAAKDEPVRVTAAPGVLTVSTGAHSEDMEADFTEDFSCLLGIETLLGVLKSCGETFRLGFTEPLKPVHIHSGSLRAALLPRRSVQ